MKNFRQIALPLLLLTLSGILSGASFAQTPNQRLVLKDGSYQIVKKYEVVGDRVRYISAERGGDWEEIPKSLVDWAATEAWARTHAPGATGPVVSGQQAPPPGSAAAAEIDKEARDERERMPTVAEGLRLPDEDGVFMLDTFQGTPELIDVLQNSGGLNTPTPHNVLRAVIPGGGNKQIIQLEGYKAKAELHVNQPVIYISLDDPKDPQQPSDDALTVDTHGASSIQDKKSHSSPASRYMIVRMQVKRETRVINATRLSLLGKPEPSLDIVQTTAELLPGGHWLRITPKQPLEIYLAVWDFGVNPRAPEARNAIAPVELAH
jgi:hypothetical protein